MAIDNDVHIVGASSLAAGHNTLIPALKKALVALGGEHIILVVGGVIPAQDYKHLLKSGASMVFGPGTKITDASNKIITLIESRK